MGLLAGTMFFGGRSSTPLGTPKTCANIRRQSETDHRKAYRALESDLMDVAAAVYSITRDVGRHHWTRCCKVYPPMVGRHVSEGGSREKMLRYETCMSGQTRTSAYFLTN
jgi:hypothetical protein